MFPPQTTSSTMYGFTVIPFIDNRRSRLPPLETTGCAHVPCERDVVCPLSQLGADGGQCGRNLLYEHAARLHDQAQLTGTLQHPLRVGPRLDEEVADPEAPHVLHDAHAESGRYDEICPGDGSGEGSGSVVRVRVKVTRAGARAPTASTTPASTASAKLVKHLPVLSRGLTRATGRPWLSRRSTMRDAALLGLSTSPTTAHERWRSTALPASAGARSSASRLATRREERPMTLSTPPSIDWR
eukprot:scaffold134_cov61-Phaeocystis_antarctica.AAC.5